MVSATDGVDVTRWSRPHPITILVEIGTALRSIVGGLVILSGGFGGGGYLAELAVVTLPLGGALARWFTTRYALDAEAVHLHHGLIWRKRQVMPRSNVQNVSTSAGVVARLGSVVQLQISDASSTGDIKIRYIRATEADRLTTMLRPAETTGVDLEAAPVVDPDLPQQLPAGQRDAPTAPSGPGIGTAPPSGPAISTVPPSGPAISTVPPSEAAISKPPSGPAIAQSALVEPSISELLGVELSKIGSLVPILLGLVAGLVGLIIVSLDLVPITSVETRTQWLAVAAALLIPLVAVGGDAIVQILKLGGFKLMAEPDRLRIQMGLLTEAKRNTRRERLQQIRVERQLVHSWLGRERIKFETADAEAVPGLPSYLSPAARTGDWHGFAREGFGRSQLTESDLGPVSPLTRRRVLVRFAVISILWLGLGVISPLLPIPLLAATVAAGWWYAAKRFETLGWALSDDQYLIRTGVIFGRLTLVSLDKVQIVRTDATFFQRRLGLATVRVSTAGIGFGGLVQLPDLPIDEANDLHHALAVRAAATSEGHTL